MTTAEANVAKRARRGSRGGRKPGAWTIVKEGELLAFRRERGVSRSVMARALGCSATSVQNWETGVAVPTGKNQADIRKILDDPAILDAAEKGAVDGTAAPLAAVAQATAMIVAGVYHGDHDAEPAKVAAMVSAVRQALEGRGATTE